MKNAVYWCRLIRAGHKSDFNRKQKMSSACKTPAIESKLPPERERKRERERERMKPRYFGAPFGSDDDADKSIEKPILEAKKSSNNSNW